MHFGVSSKLRFESIPDREVLFPVVSEGLHAMHIRFLLCAIAFHPGSAPTGGHYKALMLQDGDVYVVDDGTTAVICDSEEFADSCHNSYLFFYYLPPPA